MTLIYFILIFAWPRLLVALLLFALGFNFLGVIATIWAVICALD